MVVKEWMKLRGRKNACEKDSSEAEVMAGHDSHFQLTRNLL